MSGQNPTQSVVPIVITILKHKEQYLFIKRKKPPYENLWSLVGGKLEIGEHIKFAAIREIEEETGANNIDNFQLRGFVSERLVDSSGSLIAHFHIYVGYAEIDSFRSDNREGLLALFTEDDVNAKSDVFLPSDLEMFSCFLQPPSGNIFYEAELVYDNGYHLRYYRRT